MQLFLSYLDRVLLYEFNSGASSCAIRIRFKRSFVNLADMIL